MTAATFDGVSHPERFQSLADLTAAHDALLEIRDTVGDDTRLSADAVAEIDVFVARARATGALLDETRDRRAAQSILDYWSSTLFRAGYPANDTKLQAFDPSLAPTLPDEPCPYRGLEAFRDGEFFHGRERLIGTLLHKLEELTLIAVVGASGSGKSSVVLGGLLPRLKSDALPGSATWRYVVMVPGSNPIANLQQAEAQAPHDEAAGQRTVLVVDQFEEVFTLCTDEALRNTFAATLLARAQRHDAVVLTMRTDYADNAVKLTELYPLFEAGQVDVRAMDINELREAIEKPATKVGLKFEEGIVDDLISSILGERAGLPLLQFTLLQLWESRDHNRVTRQAYKQVGSPRDALERAAERFYTRLIPEDQETARRILTKMVKPDLSSLEFTSRRIPKSELFRGNVARDRVERVLDKLIDERLVKLSPGEVPGDEQVEVAHEALVRNWRRLSDWLDDNRDLLRRRALLAEIARQWKNSQLDDSALLRGQALEESEGFSDLNEIEQEFVAFSRKTQEAAGQAKLQQQLELTAAQVRAEEQARSARRLRGLVVGLVIIGALAFATAVFALGQREVARQNAERAEEQARIATSRRLAALADAQTKGDLSLLLALEARKVDSNAQVRSSLLQAINGNSEVLAHLHSQSQAISQLAFGPDGRVLTSISDKGRIVSWDISTRKPISHTFGEYPLGEPAAESSFVLQYSPDGTAIATARKSDNRVVLLYPGRTSPVSDTRSFDASIQSVAFSPDSKTVAVSGANGKVWLWEKGEVASQVRWLGSSDPANYIAFSPDGEKLAAGGIEGVVTIWHVASQKEIAKIEPKRPSSIVALMFRANGNNLALLQEDRDIEVWDLEPKQLVDHISNYGCGTHIRAVSLDGTSAVMMDQCYQAFYDVNRNSVSQIEVGNHDPSSFGAMAFDAMAVNNDGSLIGVSAPDGRILLFRVKSGRYDATATQLRRQLIGADPYIYDARLSREGSKAIWIEDEAVGYWDLTSNSLITRPVSFPAWESKLSLDGVGVISTESIDNLYEIWMRDPTSGDRLRPLLTTSSDISVNALSSDQELLAVASYAGRISIHSTRISTATQPSVETGSGIEALAFSGDSKTLVAMGEDKTVSVWSAPWNAEIVAFKVSRLSSSEFAISPNGRSLALASDVGVIVWSDIKTTSRISETLPLPKGTYCLAYSPDGRLLLAGGADGEITIWDTRTLRLISQAQSGRDESIDGIAFHQDSKRFVTRGDKLIIWDLANPIFPTIFAIAPRPYLNAQTIAYLPETRQGVSQIIVGGTDGIVSFDLTVDPPVSRTITSQPVSMLAAGKDGTYVASDNLSNTVLFWNISTGVPISLSSHTSKVLSIAISPDELLVASGSYSGTVLVWNLNLKQTTPITLSGAFSDVLGLAFSPDGKKVVAGDRSGALTLWDLESRKPISELSKHDAGVNRVAFSPNGMYLASIDESEKVVLWSVAADQLIWLQTIEANRDESQGGLAFSPDSRTLAVGGSNGLWDIKSRQSGGPIGSMSQLSFSPDGQEIAALNQGGVSVFNLEEQNLRDLACKIANRNLTREEWNQYIGDEAYRKTCPDLPGPGE